MPKTQEPVAITVRVEARDWRAFADILLRSSDGLCQDRGQRIKRRMDGKSGLQELDGDADLWGGLLGRAERVARRGTPEMSLLGEITRQVSWGMFH